MLYNLDTESTLFQQVSAISVVVVVMLLFTASIASLVVIPCRKWYKDRKHDIREFGKMLYSQFKAYLYFDSFNSMYAMLMGYVSRL